MQHPQSKALNIGLYGCLAMSYLYCVGIDPAEHIKIVSDAIDRGLIQQDCTVYDAAKYLKWITGKNYIVKKMTITDIKDIQEPTPVRYTYTDASGVNHSHWVVAEGGKIAYNPLAISQSVIKGKPDAARIIELC